tara:strand:- start:1485 stop:2774 length:1290 start_codon:yes stop_codon:yes gene_type:complete
MNFVKIAIAGIGTVGGGFLKIFEKNQKLFEKKINCKINISAIASRAEFNSKNFKNSKIFRNAKQLMTFDDYDILIELIGGDEGVAKDIVFNALEKKKHVITANKALISKHGNELSKLAKKNKCNFGFEAAVAGGVPIISILKEFLISNTISKVSGILNGTSNFILSKMLDSKKDFQTILSTAQKLGYAEADPSYDIDGTDTAHKLAIISSLAFDSVIDLESIYISGIKEIDLIDLKFADSLGYKIKLIGITQKIKNKIIQFVYPSLINKKSEIANVDDVYNGIFVESDFSNKLFLQGEGAGAYSTATSIFSDIEKVFKSKKFFFFSLNNSHLKKRKKISINERFGSYYLRFTTIDKPGVIADISKEFKKFQISMKTMLQEDVKSKKQENATIVVTTHDCFEKNMKNALTKINSLSVIVKKTIYYRIESF